MADSGRVKPRQYRLPRPAVNNKKVHYSTLAMSLRNTTKVSPIPHKMAAAALILWMDPPLIWGDPRLRKQGCTAQADALPKLRQGSTYPTNGQSLPVQTLDFAEKLHAPSLSASHMLRYSSSHSNGCHLKTTLSTAKAGTPAA